MSKNIRKDWEKFWRSFRKMLVKFGIMLTKIFKRNWSNFTECFSCSLQVLGGQKKGTATTQKTPKIYPLCCVLLKLIMHCYPTFSVIFFNTVSSKTACNLRFISKLNSKVIELSSYFALYRDAIIPPYLLISAYYKKNLIKIFIFDC